MRLLRRLGQSIVDTLAMGGLTSMGGPRHPGTGHPLQTRAVADSLLATLRDEGEQSEGEQRGRARASRSWVRWRWARWALLR